MNSNVKVLVATLLLAPVALTGCTSSSGKDFAGNGMKGGDKSTSAAPSAATDEDTAEPEETQEEESGPKGFNVGQVATITKGDADAAEITIGKPKFTTKNANEYLDKAKNGTFAIFPIEVKAVGKETFDINPFDFYARDAEGTRFEYGDGSMYLDDKGINATTLNPGEKIKGFIALDINKNTHELVYAPTGQALGFWKF